ncbi:hypothetical protein LY90DRAFT_667826 [Neocallimastix californiae]|uniref:P-loop containing nucleoside triphosphate hydrolase protein n=1 Tax=Neocallimastix californiae TaxID=1754190 RepID=A0A1Y2E6I5_9FUNG|nr:hypothetical protein LY90DRAFT_667826 [Neocallimastix californiae]|eukprot:ORY66896.1 hypothetical protein LY90DRAFT_667826 [Neocallimastix californiae]
MTSKSKYNFTGSFLGNNKYNEPEQIVMNSYDLNVDGDEDMPIPLKPFMLQKIIDEYSENSSVDNGSLCEMNCIPCYNSGDKRSLSYIQKLQYYTTVGKDECPRIFDYNQLPTFNEQFNNFTPRRHKSFSNNSFVSNTTPTEQPPVSSTTPRIPLNNSLNIDNNESYYSDASVETLNPTPSESSSYYIKTYTSDNESYTRKSSSKESPSIKNGTIHSLNPKKSFHLFKPSIPIISSQEEMKFKDILELRMTPLKRESSESTIDTTSPIKKITNSIKNLKINTNITKINNKSFNINKGEEGKEEEAKEEKKEEGKDKIEKDIRKETERKGEEEEEKEKDEGREEEERKVEIKKETEIKENDKQKVIKLKSKKHSSSVSKYDFVKVLVYLSGEHYYVLSRFLISRMLTATQVDYYHAVRIALDLKKQLVDYDELELSQKKLEKNLFSIMKRYGYNEKNIELYRLLSAFYRERIPLIILISGPRCVGKSTLATKLAERLNLPNIVKTDYVYDLMCSIFNVPEEDREPIWYRNCSTDELLEKYEKNCELVKKGLEADIKKAFTEGKSIIIEGTHVNHILYDFVLECISKFSNQEKEKSSTKSNAALETLESGNAYSSKLLTVNNNPCNAIVLPLYLDMNNKKCHKEYLHNQMMKEVLINNQNDYQTDYFALNDLQYDSINLGNDKLCEFESKIDIIGNLFRKENAKRQHEKTSFGESKAFKYINVEAKSFQHTLDVMHNEVLNKIQEKFSISE